MTRDLMFPIRLNAEEKQRLQAVADELQRSKAESIRLLVETAAQVWETKQEDEKKEAANE